MNEGTYLSPNEIIFKTSEDTFRSPISKILDLDLTMLKGVLRFSKVFLKELLECFKFFIITNLSR